MEIAELLVSYRRFLKRRNCSFHTVKNYMSILNYFTAWILTPLSLVTHKEIGVYVGHLLRTRKPKTINCHLGAVRAFFDYLIDEEGIVLINPVRKGHRLRLPRPLPMHLKDDQIPEFFKKIKDERDRAIFMIMLRCGLRVDEVAHLTMNDIVYGKRQIFVANGKGRKDRVVYISDDAQAALQEYLKKRKSSEENRVFLGQKGPLKGKPISVRGVQKRIEYYAKKSGIAVSCHHLRHTMATQLLNADADIVTIQDLLGHSRVTTTQRYCRVSNLKVQRDYFKSITVVIQRSQQAAVDGLGINQFIPTAIK